MKVTFYGRDLGADMVYGAVRSTKVQQSRIRDFDSNAAYWQVSLWEKWSFEFYGFDLLGRLVAKVGPQDPFKRVWPEPWCRTHLNFAP